MKFSTITLLALQAISIASGSVAAVSEAEAEADSKFWKAFVDDVDSFPTPPPTPRPTPSPTPFPTGECKIDSCVNCTTVMDSQEISCEDISEEDKPVCNCPECVREVKFKYTGLACDSSFSANGKCVDEGPNPIIAKYRITNCEDSGFVLATGEAQKDDYITISPGGAAGNCLPECLSTTISDPAGAVTQTFEIDSECNGGNGLVLVNNYGAFESIGYSCSETDTHNCIAEVSYGLKVCNTGSTEEQIYVWFLTINEEEIDLLQDVPPGDVMLSPGECYYDTYVTDVNRCVESESCVNMTANATNPETGLPPNCPGKDDIKFGWEINPTPPPTPAPTPGPTPPPTPGPTPPPTPGPTPPPTPGPTPPPTPGPTPPPTPMPTPAPSPEPSSAPTGECKIDTCVNCTTVINNEEIACEDIPQENQPVCNCPECVRELKFKYTGLACSSSFSASGKCADEGPNPFIAGYRITTCEDSSVVVATGEAQQGDYITISPGGTALDCLPECLSATISVPTGAVTQTFEIDSECGGGNGLILINNYGAFESIGYSCSETDTHNCIQRVSYGLKVCNTGSTEEQIYDWFLTIDEEEIDLLQNIPPEDIMLGPGECFYDTYEVDVNRCVEFETCVNVTASATNPETGLPPNCPSEDGLKYKWDRAPTLPPTPNPSPFPSPAPSPAPTSSCVIDVNLTGCPQYNSSLDNDCQGRPWEITFRYNGGGCSQSDNLQPRQKFSCTDTGSGPPRSEGDQSYITAVPRGGSDLYFSGSVAVGEKYTLNEDRVYDKLSADMTITIYNAQGGDVLQVVDLHLSCSQPLFLFDKFGASQVTEWVETSGRVVSDKQSDVETGTIEVKLDTSTDVVKPVRLLEMTVLTNTQDQPIDYTSQVAGMVLGPGDTIELPGFEIDIDLSARTRYTFFTTIIGETLDGTNMCNGFSFLECTIGFNLLPVFPTMVPTPSPTITPFPTRDPNTTTCEIDADITCNVLSLEGVECDQILAPKSRTCPAGAELLVAYLRYDGSLGQSVFIEIVCDESTTYIDRQIVNGETIAFRTRANSCGQVSFIISEVDPDLGGSNLGQETVSTSCPGPWTLGSKIANSLVLDAYIDTEDDGATFTVNVLEAEVEFNFVAENSGQFPLTVVSGTISDTISGIGGTSQVGGLPVNLLPRSQTTLETVKETINLDGRGGDVVTISLSLVGQTNNQFALPCEDEDTITFNL